MTTGHIYCEGIKKHIYPAGGSAPSLSGDKEEQSTGKRKVTNSIFNMPGALDSGGTASGKWT